MILLQYFCTATTITDLVERFSREYMVRARYRKNISCVVESFGSHLFTYMWYYKMLNANNKPRGIIYRYTKVREVARLSETAFSLRSTTG